MGATGGGMVSRVELCREASPAAFGGRAGKKRREKWRKVCIFYMLTFSSFFCASLQTQKGMVLLCISLCIHKKEKNVYVKLHTANKAGVMRAYVYVCILRKCSGWFRCTDFRKFCAGLFAYFFCWQPCGRQSLRAAGEVCMFICTKKKTKCICLHTQKKEQNAYVYICKILSDMHSLTYTQKKLPAECRQQRCICLYAYIFSPTQIPAGRPAGKK